MRSVLVLGGARSGKSSFAESLVLKASGSPVYLATASAGDDEMQKRISMHQHQRGEGWLTIEEPLALVDTLQREALADRAILVDCLTLWLTNLMMGGVDIDIASKELADCVGELPVPVVFVSNEVGQGIVPADRLSRDFRDYSGRLHQMMASACNEVWFVTAGLPQKLK